MKYFILPAIGVIVWLMLMAVSPAATSWESYKEVMVSDIMVSLIEMGAPPHLAEQMGVCVADVVIKNITGVCEAPDSEELLRLSLNTCFSGTDKKTEEMKARVIMGAMECEKSLGQ